MDQHRFTSMLSRHESSLRKYALKLTGDYDDANDLFQDTCLRGWRFLHQFQEGTSEIGWLSRIMRNHFRNGYRRVKATPEMCDYQDVYNVFSPLAQQKDSSLADELTEALSSLTEESRFIFWMVHVEDYTYREIGKILGMHANTLRVSAHKSRMAMQKVLS